MKRTVLLLILLGIPLLASAQTPATKAEARKEARTQMASSRGAYDLSTNFFDWADLGTINVDFGMSFARHFSFQAGLKYNPWNFKINKGPITQMRNQQKSISVGVRYWPWYVFSGWWLCGKVQYCDYSETGVWRQALDMGKALGAGLSTGYTIMLNKKFNIEIGAGFWGGRLLEHAMYHCPDECFERDDAYERGPKNFIALNDLNVSFHWVF